MSWAEAGPPAGVLGHVLTGTFFQTTIELRPTLQRQRDDAAKGQVGRLKIFDGLLDRLEEHEAS